ncbi:hypothetical protein [Streptodolium elevatio]
MSEVPDHTVQKQTYDPVLDVMEPSRWRLTTPLRPPGPGRALVLVRDDGSPLVVHAGDEIPSPRYGGYRKVFTVDLGEHRLVLDIPLLSRDPAFSFRSRVDLVCKVTSPTEIVTRGIRDMSGAMYGYLRKLLREVARCYDIAEFHEAETALNAALGSFTGDDAVRLRNIHVELLVDEDEIATSGREFRDVVRDTRLARMRRGRHVEMLRDEGIEGLIAEIVEREGPRAALAWIDKDEAEKRAVKSEVLRMVLERGDADREPFEQAELERAVLAAALRDGEDGLGAPMRRGRLGGSPARALEPGPAEPAEAAPEPPLVSGEVLRESPERRGGGRVSGVGREPGAAREPGSRRVPGAGRTPGAGGTSGTGDTPERRREFGRGTAPRRAAASEAPPEDEPLPPPGRASAPRTADAPETPTPRVSRVRGTAKRRPTDNGGEPR